jgi:polyphosphate kinase
MKTEEDSSAAWAQALTLEDPRLFHNRELSLLSFQERVLGEAQESFNPLLERLNFLSILGSNIDEFFMVRVAGLKQKAASGTREIRSGGMSGTELLETIRSEVIRLTERAYHCLLHDIRPELERSGIALVDYADLNQEERTRLDEYFHRTVFLVLAPLAFDTGRPFPHISNLSLNLAVVVQDARGQERFARVKIPDTLPQIVPVPAPESGDRSLRYVWLEQLIIANLQPLFPGLEIKEAHPFRVTRDAETSIQELESDDLLETIEEAVWRRRFRDVVRLQVDTRISGHILQILTSQLELEEKDVYLIEGPLDLRRLRELYALDRPDLKYKPFLPYTPSGLEPNAKEDIFSLIRGGDILLHHPFESFQPVVEFIRLAAHDPDVLAIKITLYRVGRNSPIVQALLEAIEEGKQVSVLLELKARFDEESNIEWAKALEREGVHVIYGLVGLKVHSKIALVVRREGDIMRRYVHLGTGNYNPLTARLYTDLSLFTCDEEIGADATDLFNYLTGYSAKTDFRKLLVAPITLRRKLEGMILREIEIAKQGGKGHLIFKMNALEDPGMIKLLYRASQAGVEVDLLVRGLCCLRPGVAGVSDHIKVTSIIGRFLEHTRIYYFRNGGPSGGKEEIYLGSADLMLRNLNHRIEIVFPVESPSLVQRIRNEILEVYLADNVNAYQAKSDGTYHRPPRSQTTGGIDSHQRFMTRRRASERFYT